MPINAASCDPDARAQYPPPRHQFHLIGVLLNLLLHGVDQLQRSARVLALEAIGIDQMEKNSALRFPLRAVSRLKSPPLSGSAEIEVFVQKALWRVSVRIDYDRRPVHPFGAQSFDGSLCWLWSGCTFWPQTRAGMATKNNVSKPGDA